MQLNYTENARQVLKLAEKAAKQGGHRYIGSEHLLLALVREPVGTAGAILRENHVEEQRLLELIGELVAPEVEVSKDAKEWSPRAKSILRESEEMAHFF